MAVEEEIDYDIQELFDQEEAELGLLEIGIEPEPDLLEPESEQEVEPGPCRSSRTPVKSRAYVLSFKGQRYDTSMLNTNDGDQAWAAVTHYVMIQFSMKAGLKHFGQRGEDAVSKELSQLYLRDTFEPLHPKDLSREEKDGSWDSHLFLKDKRDLSVKGRLVAGGDKQRGMMPAIEASSPTVSTEAVLLTATIDASERRDVATIDILNAFVQTRIEDTRDKAIVRLRGRLAELMVRVAPQIYRKFIIINRKGQTVLYIRLLNALYGLLS